MAKTANPPLQKGVAEGQGISRCLRFSTKTMLVTEFTNSKSILLAMKLTFIFLTAAFLNVSARGVSQTVTFSGKNMSLQEVLEAVEKQTGFVFFYDEVILSKAKPVSIEAKAEELKSFLDKLFQGQKLSYKIANKNVIVSDKPTPTPGLNPGLFKDDLSRLNPPPIKISGTVTGANNQLLAGATIQVKGTKNATTTKANGEFVLINVDENAVLLISSVGYETKEIKVDGKTEIVNIILSKSILQLDEVQIIAYGVTTRRMSTSNISSVRSEAIQKQPVSNPLLAMQGRVPGMVISQQSGVPGAAVNIQIQGKGSIQNGTDPFYVIDGVPFSANMLQGGSQILALSSPFSYINPADIESIDVLKDADATSIYGSRAANGAILITTKKGRAGRAIVSLDLQNGWGKVPRKVDLLNTKQFLEFRREAILNDGATVSPTDYDINGVWDTTRDIDWQKELLGKTARFTNLQASVSGGNENTRFLLGGAFMQEKSVFPGDFANSKGSGSFRLNHNSESKKLQLSFSGMYLSGRNDLPNIDPTAIALTLAPTAPQLFNADGKPNWQIVDGVTTFNNSASFLLEKYRNATNNLIGNTIASYEVISGLTLRASFGYNLLSSKERRLTPLDVYDPNIPTRARNAYFLDKSVISLIVEPQIEYKLHIGPGKMELLLGGTYQQTKNDLTGITASGFNSDLEMNNIKAASSLRVTASLQDLYRYNAAFGRLNYNMSNRYIINFTARRDGSSRFGSENRFHNFYSVGGAWIFSEENFFKNSLEVINYGKLRISYGTTGNDQIGDYKYLSLFDPLPIPLPYQGIISLGASGHSNPYLQWELTRKFNAGLELSLLQSRISLDVNYYVNTSANQLLANPLPIQTGFYFVQNNFPATVRNNGLEASISTIPVQGSDFTWRSNINITVPKNKLIAFPGLKDNPNFSSIYVIGEPITITRAFKFGGVNPQTGLYELVDINGQKVATPNTATDRYQIINIAPELYGGWQNIVTYKGFELDFLLQYSRQMGHAAELRFGNSLPPGYFNINHPVAVLDRWHAGHTDASVQKANANVSAFEPYINAQASDAAFTDVSFLRLTNASLSYTLPANLTLKAAISRVSVYVQGQNLFIATKFKGLNPEASGAINSIPPLRVITVGLRVNF